MDNPETSQEIQDLREAYRAKIFRMMLYIAGIFGIPAVAAFWIGGALDVKFATNGNTYRMIALTAAFVLSWFWVARLYIKLNKEAKDIERKAKEVAQSKEISEK